MDKSNLGDRIKSYEASTETRLLPRLPVVVRLDGRSFSKFTKGMKVPFDKDFREAMIEVTKYLVEQTHAKIGYTQSDEITLVLSTDNIKQGSVMFDGRVQKITSNFAAMASVKFLLEMQKRFPDKVNGDKKLPSFDARVFAVPSKTEAMNSVLWRVNDAVKNSISMVAQSFFSHKELQNLNGNQMQEMLIRERGVNWNDYSSNEKQGTFIRKEKVQVKLSEEQLSSIPVDKRPEGGMVTRGKMVEIDMPNFLKVTNRVEVIFDGADPALQS